MLKTKIDGLIIFTLYAFLISGFTFSKAAGSGDPVRYVGEPKQANSDYKNGYHDGQLRPAIGVQNYQILRANRTHPEWSDGLGWTYNHAPMLSYWNGKFYCEYLSNPTGEHIPPGVTLLTTSVDGKNWNQPTVVFPIYHLVGEKATIKFIHMHQRMGFYITPNGRLLLLAYYGANDGHGVGRVVREIYDDGNYSPIYFIRPNDNWTEELLYPMYTESPDSGFIQACRDLLNDKVRRMQWWEEDYLTKDNDEFYRVPWIKEGKSIEPGKAFCFYTKDDGKIVGFFKGRWVTVTEDNGETWTDPVYCETLTYGGAKVWAQRLENSRYALVYNPANSSARHPLSIATSNDGISFDNLVNVHSEVPPKRFWGREKRPGPQYVRGIIEGNGDPPGDDLWVVYSVNKEDIWISQIPVPVVWEVRGPVRDNFDNMQSGGEVLNWNIYSPKWCPVEIVEFPGLGKKCLQLKDKDPYDYAKAVRVFERSQKQTVSFQIYVDLNHQMLEIEFVSANGARLIQTSIDKSGSLMARNGGTDLGKIFKVEFGNWYTITFKTDSKKKRFDIDVNGQNVAKSWQYSVQGDAPERIVFRTGSYRLTDDVSEYKSGDNFVPGWDEPGANEPIEEAVFYIRNFSAIPE